MVRGPYRAYKANGIDWLALFVAIDTRSDGVSIRSIAEQHNVKRQTLQERYSRWVGDGRPTEGRVEAAEDHRGGHNRTFTEDQERALAEYIRAVYLGRLPINDADIAALARLAWGLLHPHALRSQPQFHASAGWVSVFKKRWRFSSKAGRPHSALHDEQFQADIDRFAAQLRTQLRRCGASLVFNCDEMRLRPVTMCAHVIGNTGKGQAVIEYQGEAKKGLTIINCARASGELLQSGVVKKGGTARCLKSLALQQLSPPFIGYWTTSGFTTPEVLLSYVETVIVPLTEGRPWTLLLDLYRSHNSEAVVKKVNEWNGLILWIPAHASAEAQPLDLTVHGVLHQARAASQRRERLDDPSAVPQFADALRHLSAAMKKVTPEVVRAGFCRAARLRTLTDFTFTSRSAPWKLVLTRLNPKSMPPRFQVKQSVIHKRKAPTKLAPKRKSGSRAGGRSRCDRCSHLLQALPSRPNHNSSLAGRPLSHPEPARRRSRSSSTQQHLNRHWQRTPSLFQVPFTRCCS
jgi:hypothetical protein